jgi:hypothetical protein
MAMQYHFTMSQKQQGYVMKCKLDYTGVNNKQENVQSKQQTKQHEIFL